VIFDQPVLGVLSILCLQQAFQFLGSDYWGFKILAPLRS